MKIKIKNIIFSREIQTISLAFMFLFLFSLPVQAKEINSKNVMQLVNDYRETQGLNMLVENCQLFEAAWEKAGDMIRNNYFAHTSPDGVSPWHWIDKNNYDYKYAGENLAIGFTTSEKQNEAWIESPSHRKNIINSAYTETGVAVRQGMIDGKYTTVTVQLFGKRNGGDDLLAMQNSKTINKENNCQEENNQQSVLFSYGGFVKSDSFQPSLKSGESENYISYKSKEFRDGSIITEKSTWIFTILILAFSILLNVSMIFRSYYHNPFNAVNAVVMMLILTVLIFWKI